MEEFMTFPLEPEIKAYYTRCIIDELSKGNITAKRAQEEIWKINHQSYFIRKKGNSGGISNA